MAPKQFLLSQSIILYSLLISSSRSYVIDASLNKRHLDVKSLSKSYLGGAHQNIRTGAIDILDISANYIRGQVNQTTQPNLNPGSRLDSNGTTPYKALQKRDGPVQCGPGSPCIDGSCCSSDGKCGYTPDHCGAKCLSNCQAKAQCGKYSADGRTKCGLNICCSYYGWCGVEDVHCHDPEPQYGKTPCQEGMGSCQIASRPHCGKGSGTATKRRIAYYQSWNLRERKCDKVRPKDLNLKGLTHLYYAFLFFDPQTFQVKLMDDADEPLLREFTDLKKKGPETWIAVGGWSFSDEGATHHAFSDMVSSKQNRAAFITSLIAFMDKYGFQGADIDWEYPGDERRGGRKKDTLNLSLLIMEMRVRFNSHSPRLGLSMAIAPDYEYLRHFDVKAMEPLVDWFGFMGYDLAGAWDADNAAGRTMRAHTDITLVEKGMRPLDFAGVNPSKINLGMAYYGRSYRVPRSGAFCQTPGQCKFEDYGQAGECTSSKGVLSNKEIKRMISNPATKGRSFFNQTGMYKYITHYGDGLNVVAYDDADTFKMKMEYANDRCLGGTMIWSVDFDDQSGGDYGAKGGGDAAPNKPAPGGKITCYNRESQGLATPPRENWEDAINSFCDQVHGAWNDHRVDDREKFFDDQKTSRQTTITAEAEIQRGCTADVSIDDCKSTFHKLVDSCPENRGGIVRSGCMEYRANATEMLTPRTVPPTKLPARIDFWTTNSGDINAFGSSSFSTMSDARAGEGPRRDVCDMSGGPVDLNFPKLGDVWGDECNFVSAHKQNEAPGDVVGELRCKKWDTATCYRVGSPMTLCTFLIFSDGWTSHTMECLWRGADGLSFDPGASTNEPMPNIDIGNIPLDITGPIIAGPGK